MKQIYEIDDIRRFSQDTIKVEAKTPLEAVKKAYPDYEVKRDFDNTGNIVVTGWANCRNVKGCRKYVYCITPKQNILLDKCICGGKGVLKKYIMGYVVECNMNGHIHNTGFCDTQEIATKKWNENFSEEGNIN